MTCFGCVHHRDRDDYCTQVEMHIDPYYDDEECGYKTMEWADREDFPISVKQVPYADGGD